MTPQAEIVHSHLQAKHPAALNAPDIAIDLMKIERAGGPRALDIGQVMAACRELVSYGAAEFTGGGYRWKPRPRPREETQGKLF